MAVEKIHIERFLDLAGHTMVLDVRSPAEYAHAHIPGAISFPLFTDEERKIVGTAYKQESREMAIKKGLDFFGPKMRQMTEEIESLTNDIKNTNSNSFPSKQILIHCWRGGMRSAGVAWLLDLYGYKVFTLIGGYKAYRNYVLQVFNLPLTLRVIGGFTGSDKTGLLRQLESRGELVIDLEALANHKGSAFGNIGMPAQPGQEMFENLLAVELKKVLLLQSHPGNAIPIWIEDESQRIGLVNIPGSFWQNMRSSKIYFLDIPFEERLLHIVKEYGSLDREKLKGSILRIKDKLGGLNAKNAILLLEQGEIHGCFRILLEYYDKLYLKALHNRKSVNSLLHSIECKSITSENANTLIHYTNLQAQKV